MTSNRDQRTQTAAGLRAGLANYGGIGFRTNVPLSSAPPPSVAPARSLAPPKPLATSGAGVSLAASAPEPKKSRAPLLLALGGLGTALAVAVAGGLWWQHSHAPPGEISSAAPVVPGPTQSSLAATANAATAAGAAVGPSSSAAPAVSEKTQAPNVSPAVLDPRALAAPSVSVKAAQSAVGSGTPRAAAPHGRADERGLAKDNPFK